MRFFDRFKKKKEEPAPSYPSPPEADTMAILLFAAPPPADALAESIRKRFGADAVRSLDNSHPKVPALLLDVEGLEFWCSVLPMPYPAKSGDLFVSSGCCSETELAEMQRNQAFLVLAQKGGGQTLDAKRQGCRVFSRLAGFLMEQEGALGVYANSAELLISRSFYLKHAAILEENRNDPAYFPAPLWVSIRQGRKGNAAVIPGADGPTAISAGDIFMTGTWGLRQFGLLELWFLSPSAEFAEICQRLYLLSVFQITGRDLYKNTDTIQFTPGKTSTFKELQGALFIVESD